MAVLAGRTGRNIFANFVGQGVASLLSLALVPVYIRYIGIEAYAIVGLFVVIQSWMALLDLGMTPTLGREVARFTAGTVAIQHIRDLLRSLETIYLGLALVVAITLTIGAPLLATRWLQVETLPLETVAGALSLVGGVVALRFCEGIYRGGLMALQQQVWVNVMATLLALLRSLGALAVLEWVSPTILAFLLWQGVVSLVSLAVLAVRLHISLPAAPRRPAFSVPALREVGGFAGGVFAISLLGVVLTQIDKLLLSRLLPLAEFGYFMLASTMVGVLYMVSWPVAQAVSPRLVQLLEGRDAVALANGYHRACQLVTVLLAPAVLVLALFSHEVIFAWSGDTTLSAGVAPILGLLAFGTGIHALLQLPALLQLASGWTGLSLRLNIVAVIVLVPALFLLVPEGGTAAAAGIWAALNVFYLLAMVPLMHRRLLPGEMMRWYVRDVGVPLLAVLAVTLPAALLGPLLGMGRWSWLAYLVGVGLLALAAAAMAAPLVRGQLLAAIGGIRRRGPAATP
ncbi:oligosaccharide flippase family protein [Polymorphobacter sp.]|uniref:oligosaccharide flippase family protein n=1 Tax=Polymorphobacter sp. TaxID=1909290 RepID=UPI003F7184BE